VEKKARANLLSYEEEVNISIPTAESPSGAGSSTVAQQADETEEIEYLLSRSGNAPLSPDETERIKELMKRQVEAAADALKAKSATNSILEAAENDSIKAEREEKKKEEKEKVVVAASSKKPHFIDETDDEAPQNTSVFTDTAAASAKTEKERMSDVSESSRAPTATDAVVFDEAITSAGIDGSNLYKLSSVSYDTAAVEEATSTVVKGGDSHEERVSFNGVASEPRAGQSVLVDMGEDVKYPARVDSDGILLTGEGWAENIETGEWSARVSIVEVLTPASRPEPQVGEIVLVDLDGETEQYLATITRIESDGMILVTGEGWAEKISVGDEWFERTTPVPLNIPAAALRFSVKREDPEIGREVLVTVDGEKFLASIESIESGDIIVRGDGWTETIHASEWFSRTIMVPLGASRLPVTAEVPLEEAAPLPRFGLKKQKSSFSRLFSERLSIVNDIQAEAVEMRVRAETTQRERAQTLVQRRVHRAEAELILAPDADTDDEGEAADKVEGTTTTTFNLDAEEVHPVDLLLAAGPTPR